MHASRTTPWFRLALEGIGWALTASGTAAVAFYAIPSLQLLNRVTVMSSAFIPYGLPAFAGAAVIFVTSDRRRLRPLAVAAVAGVVLLAWWAKPYWPATATASGGNSLTLLTMNLRCNHSGTSDLGALALRTGPDVVVVQGFDSTQRSALGDAWSQALPHSAFHPMSRQSGCGTLVASRTPLRTLSAPEDAQPVVEVGRPSGPLVLLPVDLPTPTNGVDPWLDAFAHLSEAVRAHRDRPLVVAGDFNRGARTRTAAPPPGHRPTRRGRGGGRRLDADLPLAVLAPAAPRPGSRPRQRPTGGVGGSIGDDCCPGTLRSHRADRTLRSTGGDPFGVGLENSGTHAIAELSGRRHVQPVDAEIRRPDCRAPCR